jgi:hypothetical protein
MPSNPYKVQGVVGLRSSNRRSIAFLLSNEDVEAYEIFKNLRPNRRRELMTRFDYWIDGGIRDSYFHGWPNDAAHKYCFTFKWKENTQNHRFYGFLFNPRPNENPSFQVCVLTSHATKNERDTDKRELDRATGLRSDKQVIAAVEAAFPQAEKGKRPWLN